ncbi:lanthionine synthetase LanC family protein [Chitinophaga sp. 22536]|uniref:lanthionine synthetase LanC family protein n=1 Tax=unclassified Chitinophaga TaxID=2619133 RepID=UPI003F8765C2
MENPLVARLKNILLTNTIALICNGLEGKAGACIFFFHYFRATGKTVYSDFAAELLEILIEKESNTRQQPDLSLSKGITGIGAALIYLYESDFLDIELNDFLSPIDKELINITDIFSTSVATAPDVLIDIAFYWTYRLQTEVTQQLDPAAAQQLYQHLEKIIYKLNNLPVNQLHKYYFKLAILDAILLKHTSLRLAGHIMSFPDAPAIVTIQMPDCYWMLLFTMPHQDCAIKESIAAAIAKHNNDAEAPMPVYEKNRSTLALLSGTTSTGGHTGKFSDYLDKTILPEELPDLIVIGINHILLLNQILSL